MGGFAIGITEFATMSLLPDFARSLHIDAPTAGHAISAYALGVVVGAPAITILAAKMRRRTLLIGLMIVFALGNLLAAFSQTYPQMLAFRFLSGLPHGAYFGIATLVAASLVPRDQRVKASAYVLLGLTIANIIGTPFANLLGQIAGWRSCFIVVAVLAIMTAGLVWRIVPDEAPDAKANPLRELGALKKPQVWLTLGIGAIGFGGMFSVYTYLADTMTHVTGVSQKMVPLALMIFGIGMFSGSLIIPRFERFGLLKPAAGVLVFSAIALSLYWFTAAHLPLLLMNVVAIGMGGMLAPLLQTRLMDVAGDAQALAAALNHSAFNAANALGPFLGGLAISAGYGWQSTGPVGAGLALGGLAILGVSVSVERGAKPSL
ncbi:MFS transporter [Pseudonocardia sp. TMWB2A]|uniref:MFS transporter n=1 Tax=Pseudonocardia sp. TMWB2A TaxID=687430 RepID=UPI00307DB3A9